MCAPKSLDISLTTAISRVSLLMEWTLILHEGFDLQHKAGNKLDNWSFPRALSGFYSVISSASLFLRGPSQQCPAPPTPQPSVCESDAEILMLPSQIPFIASEASLANKPSFSRLFYVNGRRGCWFVERKREFE